MKRSVPFPSWPPTLPEINRFLLRLMRSASGEHTIWHERARSVLQILIYTKTHGTPPIEITPENLKAMVSKDIIGSVPVEVRHALIEHVQRPNCEYESVLAEVHLQIETHEVLQRILAA